MRFRFLMLLAAAALPAAAQSTLTVNMNTYSSDCAGLSPATTVCLESFADAISHAKAWFATPGNSNGQYTIKIPTGTFDFSEESTLPAGAKGVIDVSGVSPAAGGWLLIEGSGPPNTILITTQQQVTIYGSGVSHVHFQGFSLERNDPTYGGLTVSQGEVTATATNSLTLAIPQGFPDVATMGIDSGDGGYIRLYDVTDVTNPTLYDYGDNNNAAQYNQQIQWKSATCSFTGLAPSGGGTCTLSFSGSKTFGSYVDYQAALNNAHLVACVKSKFVSKSYAFMDSSTSPGTDVGFDHVTWYDASGGSFAYLTDVYVTNSYIKRRGLIHGNAECISNPFGGPQINEGKYAFPPSGAVVDTFNAEAAGDDAVAVFSDNGDTGTSPTITNSIFHDEFARSIYLYESDGVTVTTGDNDSFYDCDNGSGVSPNDMGTDFCVDHDDMP